MFNPINVLFKSFLIGLLISGSNFSFAESVKAISSSSPNYNEIFNLTRKILADEFLTQTHKIKAQYKNLPETFIVETLIQEKITRASDLPKGGEKYRQVIETLQAEAKKNDSGFKFDPTKHVRLIPPMGTSGYTDLQFYVNHDYKYSPTGKSSDEVPVPKANLVKVWNEFLERASKQIVLNIFDFDLDEIAETLIRKGEKGISVRVGIDKNEIEKLPSVKKIYEKLKSSKGVEVIPVDSVGLNHQKMAAIDWSDQEKSRVLFSSGNLTQSCLDPEGDLKGFKYEGQNSIPNANHVITMKSWLLSVLVNHELSKTFDPELRLRGAQYPLTGAYQVTGSEVEDPQNILSEARPLHSLVISFTPGGGYKDVNLNLIARLINDISGPVRLIQFAFSSDAVGEAILARAQKAYLAKTPFNFLAVGDTPFALQYWSQFLKLSGWKLEKKIDGKKKRFYVEDSDSPWYKAFNREQWIDMRSKIFVGPKEYGIHSVKLEDGTIKEVNAKIHHKVLSIGDFSIVGTSFNFTKSAEKNNEQILIFHEPDIARRVEGMAQYLINQSGRTVTKAVEFRNARNDSKTDPSDDNNAD